METMNIIHPTFEHGKNFKIGNFCIIEEDVVVGDNVKIENYVLLKRGTIIQDGVFIDSYARSSGNNIIGKNVTLRYGCTIAKEVVIRDNTYISPNVMTIFSNPKGKSEGEIIIGKNVFIGTAAVIGSGVTIGHNVIIGAMAYVNKNCLDGGTYIGVPAKRTER